MKTPGATKIGKGDSFLSFEQSTAEIENDEDFIEDRIIRAWVSFLSSHYTYLGQFMVDFQTSLQIPVKQ